MRKAHMLPAVLLASISLAAVGALNTTVADTQRSDCPGKIVCPQTGELICRDKCPTADPARPDCPGRITCPQTGELVCKDRCPLARNGTAPESPKAKAPSCCAKRGQEPAS